MHATRVLRTSGLALAHERESLVDVATRRWHMLLESMDIPADSCYLACVRERPRVHHTEQTEAAAPRDSSEPAALCCTPARDRDTEFEEICTVVALQAGAPTLAAIC